MKKETMWLTEQQFRIYQYLQRHIQNEGFPPTYREIAKNFKFSSVNGVRCHLMALKRKGVIDIRPNISRGIVMIRGAKIGVQETTEAR
jgi:repressor LexA